MTLIVDRGAGVMLGLACGDANRTRQYRAWRRLVNSPRNVCQRWCESFQNFLEDMGEKPRGQMLARVDDSKPYQPGNCRWSTRSEWIGLANRTRFITHDGKTLHLNEWERLTGINHEVIAERIKHGWTVVKALTTPVMTHSQKASQQPRKSGAFARSSE